VDGEPRQKVNEGNLFKVHVIDLQGIADNETVAMEKIMKEAAAPFDLERGPLIKASLYQLEADKYLFFYSLHHIIADGWSMEVLVNDIMTLYHAGCDHEAAFPGPLRIQYHDYVEWLEAQLEGDGGREHKEYWKKEFNGVPLPLQLPIDLNRPARQTFNGDKVHLVLQKEEKQALLELSHRHGCTMFITLLAGINVLLCKITNQYDMVIGSPSSGRIHPELENQIGLFLNTMALRLKRERKETIGGILEDVRNTVLQATRHQLYPFDRLLQDIHYEKDPGRNSLFDVGFTHNTVGAVAGVQDEDDSLFPLEVDPVSHGFKSVKADLWFHLTETNDKIIVTLDYNTDLFFAATANGILNELKILLQQLTISPQLTLQQLLENMREKEQKEKLQAHSARKDKNLALLKTISKNINNN
jgi:hypothetical protein